MSESTQDLLRYIDASPTPFHAVAETAARLETSGFRRLKEDEHWETQPGDPVYVTRGGGSLAAFRIGTSSVAEAGFRLVGAHTDSPNLRVKPNPELRAHGVRQLGVEPYGGVLLHTWLDRDLSLAGRVVLEGSETRLIDFRRPILRIPSLAIHLNRKVNDQGLVLNAQKHMAPILALKHPEAEDFATMLAKECDARPAQILGWDLMTYATEAPTLSGLHGEFIHAGRIDNLASCHAGLLALLAKRSDTPWTQALVLYDHEEVGSRSAQGAASDFLRSCLQRLAGESPSAYHRAIARSFLISADMAHAIHPNYADRHEPEHQPALGAGPVIKINVNQAYATDGESWARFEAWARQADVVTQRFVVRSDMGCGSTIGPITAAELGIRTVDVGNPMLSMHSAREMAASSDVPKMIGVLNAFFSRG